MGKIGRHEQYGRARGCKLHRGEQHDCTHQAASAIASQNWLPIMS